MVLWVAYIYLILYLQSFNRYHCCKSWLLYCQVSSQHPNDCRPCCIIDCHWTWETSWFPGICSINLNTGCYYAFQSLVIWYGLFRNHYKEREVICHISDIIDSQELKSPIYCFLIHPGSQILLDLHGSYCFNLIIRVCITR